MTKKRATKSKRRPAPRPRATKPAAEREVLARDAERILGRYGADAVARLAGTTRAHLRRLGAAGKSGAAELREIALRAEAELERRSAATW